MNIICHYEDPHNPLIRMDVQITTRTVELHSSLSDDWDARADIKRILEDTAKTIAQLLRTNVKRK